MLGRNGEHHALLRLGEPDFPGGQPLVFERRVCQFNPGACCRSHLADRRGEAARAAVGDGVVKAEVARLDDDVRDFFLGDGGADLYRASGLRVDFAAHLAGGKGCAVDAIAPGAAAEHNDMVAGLRLVWMDVLDKSALYMREYAQAAAED